MASAKAQHHSQQDFLSGGKYQEYQQQQHQRQYLFLLTICTATIIYFVFFTIIPSLIYWFRSRKEDNEILHRLASAKDDDDNNVKVKQKNSVSNEALKVTAKKRFVPDFVAPKRSEASGTQSTTSTKPLNKAQTVDQKQKKVINTNSKSKLSNEVSMYSY